MTSPLPAHLAAAIRERIAVLRAAQHLDEVRAPLQSRPKDHRATHRRPEPRTNPGATTPTIPDRDADHPRSRS